MGADFLATIYHGQLAVNPDQMRAAVEALLAAPDGVVFVSDADGIVTGMIGGFVAPHFISGERIATEAFWWVQPGQRGHGVRLERRFRRWAHEHGATRVHMGAPDDEVGRIYTALGYQRIETTYARALP